MNLTIALFAFIVTIGCSLAAPAIRNDDEDTVTITPYAWQLAEIIQDKLNKMQSGETNSQEALIEILEAIMDAKMAYDEAGLMDQMNFEDEQIGTAQKRGGTDQSKRLGFMGARGRRAFKGFMGARGKRSSVGRRAATVALQGASAAGDKASNIGWLDAKRSGSSKLDGHKL